MTSASSLAATVGRARRRGARDPLGRPEPVPPWNTVETQHIADEGSLALAVAPDVAPMSGGQLALELSIALHERGVGAQPIPEA